MLAKCGSHGGAFCRTTKLKRFDSAGLYVSAECGLIFDVSIGFEDLMIVEFTRWN